MNESYYISHNSESYGFVVGKILDVNLIPRYAEVVDLVRYLGKDGWLRFCSRFSLFNVETFEFVVALSSVLRKLPDPKVEVCAGRGKLSFWLRKFGVDIIATDDYSWRLWGERICVEKMSIEEALEVYAPSTVIGSWIPANEGYGVKILRFPFVRYFLDIGEGPSAESSWMHAINLTDLRVFARRYGYTPIFLPLARWAIAQTDEPTPWGISMKTKVILFVRWDEDPRCILKF